MVEMIAQLYQLKKKAGLEDEAKLAMRRELITPWLSEFKAQASAMSEKYLKKA